MGNPGTCHNADHGEAADDDGVLQGTVVDHGSFVVVISLQGQRAIRSPAVYSACAVTVRTGRIGSHSSQSSRAPTVRRSMVARWKSAERERVRVRIRGQGEQGNHRSGRSLPCAPLPPECGTTVSATHRHCRGSGSGLRSGS